MYSEEFENLWKLFGRFQKSGLGNRGSKKRAHEQFKRLPDNHDPLTWARLIGGAAMKQAREKLNAKMRGEWFERFQHLERYIKNERWEDSEGLDELLPFEADNELLTDQRNEKIAQLTDRSWARHLM